MPFCLNARHSTDFQFSISFHQPLIASTLVFCPLDFQSSSTSLNTLPTSPIIGISTLITLLIEEGSMSTCAFVELGLKASSLPVILSSNLAPILIIRSQSCIARFASYKPCIPSIPSHRLPEAG